MATPNDMTLEICAGSVESAVAAQEAGADRVELCACLEVGGVTPSHGYAQAARAALRIPIFALVRPRPGDFLYTDCEMDQILADIAALKELGVDGIVCGALLPDGNVDIARTRRMAAAAAPLPFTFHRAFDFTPDPLRALEDAIAAGARRILTSGQQPTAAAGAGLLRQLVEAARGRISVMPGGGVNAGNVAALAATGAREFHASCSAPADSPMAYRKTGLTLNAPTPPDYQLQRTSLQAARELAETIRRL